MEDKKFRNPFPAIGKVIKYEFLHSSKKLLPLYLILLVLGLITGLSVNTNIINEFFTEGSHEVIINSTEDLEVLKQLLVEGEILNCKKYPSGHIYFSLKDEYSSVRSIMFANYASRLNFTIARRFKNSMLGEEAYLNLSLPVTIGEHLWGRFIMSFLWIIACVIVLAASSALCFIKFDLRGFFSIQEVQEGIAELSDMLAKQNLSFGRLALMLTTNFAVLSLYVIALIFAVNAIAHLVKKDRGIVKVVLIVLFVVLNAKVFSFISMPELNSAIENWGYYFTRNMNITFWIQAAFTAVYFAVTYAVFQIKLNLE